MRGRLYSLPRTVVDKKEGGGGVVPCYLLCKYAPRNYKQEPSSQIFAFYVLYTVGGM